MPFIFWHLIDMLFFSANCFSQNNIFSTRFMLMGIFLNVCVLFNTVNCILNAWSVKNKFDSIKTDTSIQKSNLIFLAETWLEMNDNVPVLSNYGTNLCGGGRGQGMVAFSTESFTFDDSKDKEKMNLIKMKHKSIDIIGVYISQKADHSNVIKNLISMVDITRPTLIIGDFNICLRKNKNNPVTNFLISAGFSQLVKETTHIEVIDILVLKVWINLIHSQGGLIDHVYILNIDEHHINLQLVPKYFSDPWCIVLNNYKYVKTCNWELLIQSTVLTKQK